MFELNDQFTDGVYDGVVSSKNYPHATTSPLAISFAVTGIPLDVYVTSSIISSDTEFEGSQLVKVSVSGRDLHFDSSTSSPASLKQSDDRLLIRSISPVIPSKHPVFLLRYKGLSAICLILSFCVYHCVM